MNKHRLATGLLLLALASCSSTTRNESPKGAREMWVGDWIHQASVDRAIVSQSAVYPYHFVDGSATLNDLGRHTLEVLAEAFQDNPGKLIVPRGAASDVLYGRRLATLGDALVAAGVDTELMTIGAGFPGGDGMSSTRVAEILAERPAASDITQTSLTGMDN